ERAGAGGIVMEEKSSSADVISIENNHVMHTALATIGQKDPIVGIRTFNALHATISGNTVIGVGPQAVQAPGLAGIQAIGPSRSMRINGNEVADVGPAGDQVVNEAAGIDYIGAFGQLEVGDNRVRRTTAGLPSSSPARWFALRIRAAEPKQGIAGAN